MRVRFIYSIFGWIQNIINILGKSYQRCFDLQPLWDAVSPLMQKIQLASFSVNLRIGGFEIFEMKHFEYQPKYKIDYAKILTTIWSDKVGQDLDLNLIRAISLVGLGQYVAQKLSGLLLIMSQQIGFDEKLIDEMTEQNAWSSKLVRNAVRNSAFFLMKRILYEEQTDQSPDVLQRVKCFRRAIAVRSERRLINGTATSPSSS